jgi:hypothetical protein
LGAERGWPLGETGVRLFGFLMFAFGLLAIFQEDHIRAIFEKETTEKILAFEGDAKRVRFWENKESRCDVVFYATLYDYSRYVPNIGDKAFSISIFNGNDRIFMSDIYYTNIEKQRNIYNNLVIYKKKIYSLSQIGPRMLRIQTAVAHSTTAAFGRVMLDINKKCGVKPEWVSWSSIAAVWVGVLVWFIGQRRRSRRLAQNPPKSGPAKWGRQVDSRFKNIISSAGFSNFVITSNKILFLGSIVIIILSAGAFIHWEYEYRENKSVLIANKRVVNGRDFVDFQIPVHADQSPIKIIGYFHDKGLYIPVKRNVVISYYLTVPGNDIFTGMLYFLTEDIKSSQRIERIYEKDVITIDQIETGTLRFSAVRGVYPPGQIKHMIIQVIANAENRKNIYFNFILLILIVSSIYVIRQIILALFRRYKK